MTGRIDDELKLVLTMDADGYIRKANMVTRAQKDVSDGFDGLAAKGSRMSSVMGGLGAGFTAVVAGITAGVTALVALDSAMLDTGLSFARKAADFESLTLALAAVDGGAQNAEVSLKRLKDIAKGPGLGVEEAVGTFAALRRGGLDRELAMSLTRELGNAVARSGGGREMLGRAGLALGQIATKPFLQGEELNQLTEAGIPAHKIVKDIFGTNDTEELKRRGIGSVQVLAALNTELQKMERVAGGAKNAFENFDEAIDQMKIKIGSGINTVLGPALNELSAELDRLGGNGELKKFGVEFATVWNDIFTGLTGGAKTTKTVIDGVMDAAMLASYVTKNLFDFFGDVAKRIGGIPGIGAVLAGGLNATPMGRAAVGGFLDFESYQRRKSITQGIAGGEAGSALGMGYSQELGKDGLDPKEPTRILKEIADNTKPLRDIRDVMLGGGTFSRNAFNAVNMGAWTGTQGQGQIAKGMQMVMAGLSASVQGQFVDLGRMRHLDPGAL